MKRLMLALAMTMLLSVTAFAQECFNAQGSALVPGLQYFNNSGSLEINENIFLSNITNSEVTCKVTIYDHDGNDVTVHSTVYTGSQDASVPVVATGTGTFKIPAHSTRFLRFYDSANKNLLAYAVVEWTSTDTRARKALIGVVKTYSRNGSSSNASKYLINNGQPF